jgi:hypothetical protein
VAGVAADLERLLPHINAVVGKQIEGVQPGLFVARSTVQALEIGDRVRPEHNGRPKRNQALTT